MKDNGLRKIAAVLTAILLLPGSGAKAFSDVARPADAEDISYVTERGLFTGVSVEAFAPEQPMTRAMAAVVLARSAKSAGVAGGQLTDVPEGAYYAASAAWSLKNNLMEAASETTFEPNRLLTGDELSGMLSRYWAWLGRADAMPELQVSGPSAVSRAEAASAFAALHRVLEARNTTILTHTAADSVTLSGKLDLPAAGAVDRVVLFVNGSGPNTYDNQRQLGEGTFRYFDLFAEQLAARGIGFFRWSTRGVSPGVEPPMYSEIDEAAYKTYLPATSVSDIGEWIGALRKDERLKDAEIYLLGWSEGTIIAPLAAKAFPQEIDGLLLAGYCNDRMDDILDWQQTGGSSMVFYGQYFDMDGDGIISKTEFNADPYQIKDLLGATFEEIDVNKDGGISQEDFRIMLAPGYEALKSAVARGDDAWLAENYGVRLTAAWFEAHAKLAPNKEILPQLTLPIEIFHGTADQNCSVAGAYAIEKAFQDAGKANLKLHVYDGYDHDLNYLLYPTTGAMPASFEDLFQACRENGAAA